MTIDSSTGAGSTLHQSPSTDALCSLFEDSPALVALLDGPSQIYLFANEAYRETFFAGADPVGRTLAQILPEANTQGFVAIIAEVFSTGDAFQAREIPFELALAGGNSREFHFNLIFKPVRDAAGVIQSTLIVANDVTEAVVMREEARQSKLQLQSALASGRMGTWRIDLATGKLSADATFHALHSAVEHEDADQAISRIAHPDDCQMVHDALARTETEGAPFDAEYRVILPDGTIRWTASRGAGVHDESGHMIAVTGIAFDINQRKVAELAVAATRARDAYLLRLDETLRIATEAPMAQRAVSRLLGENLAATRVFYTEFNFAVSDATVFQSYSQDGHAALDGKFDLACCPGYVQALESGLVMIAELANPAHLTSPEHAVLAGLGDGSLLSVPILVAGKLVASLSATRSMSAPWTAEEQFLVQATAERSWLNVQQARADAALRIAARQKDEFLAMLSHELRNPLAPISAAAQLLQFGNIEERLVRETSATISRQVRHMTGLVDDLLDVSRVTTGVITLEQELINIAKIVSDAVEQLTPQLRARRHQLQLHIAPDEALVHGDRKRLVQVFANLLGNAAKYTHDGGQITVSTKAHAEHVMVSIRDNGMGMTPALQSRAFDLFVQAERSSDRSLGGLGLGLALVKSLVALHRGTVTCNSAGLGLGSEFTICLPRTHSVAQTRAVRPTMVQPVAPGAGLRVLVVDDNIDAAAMLGMLVTAWGHTAVVEHGSHCALERARANAPQVCLLDIGLPEMDGNELARCLRADPATANALLIAITGYGQQADMAQSHEAGFDHHFLKPVDTAALRQLLAKFAVA